MKTLAVLLAIGAGATPAIAQQSADEGSRTVVVTAKRLDVTDAALKECVARACPPDQEVAAALAHAENQFVAGDYRQARRTLLATIGRVDRDAKAYPVPVANIWRAESRIAAHLGEREAMQSGQFEAVDALKAGLDRTDLRVLAQRLEVADTFAKQGKIDIARTAYRAVAGQARTLGAPPIEGAAMLRLALIDTAIAQANVNATSIEGPRGSLSANLAQARRSIAAVDALDGEAFAGFRDAAQLLSARLDAQRGDMSGVNRLAARYDRDRPERATLLYAPKVNGAGTLLDANYPENLATEIDFEGQWADVTFLIAADGTVKGATVLRGSPALRGNWLRPVLASVAGRRYAPIDVPAGLDGLRRVERYTLTAYKDAPVGSRMKTRGDARIEMLDLTADDVPTGGDVGGSMSD